ncbi:MAG TPA: phage holin family protein [Steroidobacteraceae bacterium]|jgi:fatty acid desaturase
MAHQFAFDNRGAPLEGESAAGLLGRLFTDLTALLRHEVALAKAEFHDSATQVKGGMAAFAAAAAVLLAGVLALLAAAILGLAEVLAPWASALIIGAALVIVGFVMLQVAKKKLQPSNIDMDRTRHAVKKDAEILSRRQ